MRGASADVQLHERLRAGDDDALAEIYDRCSPLVFAVAVRITGNRTAAEILTQDVFVRLWERPEAYRPDRGSLLSWLCMAARSRALEWTRRDRVRAQDQAPGTAERSESGWVDEAHSWPEPEAGAVRAVVRTLPEPQREAVLLAYYGGCTYREVASELRVSEATAKSHLRAALARIADSLAAGGTTGR